MEKILRSVLSTEFVTSRVSKDYLLGEIVSCILIKALGSNDIYKITTVNNEYILKIYSVRKCWEYNKQHYLFELNLQDFLSRNNISVPVPIKNKNASLVTTIHAPEYDKYYALYSYLPGKAWKQKNDTKRLFEFGKYLARLHRVTQDYQCPTGYQGRVVDLEFLIHKPYERIKKTNFYGDTSRFFKKLDKFIIELEKDLRTLSLDNAVKGIIHGDAHPHNHFYTEKDNTIHMFDFELSGFGYQLYDLAIYKWHEAARRKTVRERDFEAVIAGYSEYTKIGKKELYIIHILAKVRHLFILESGLISYPELTEYRELGFLTKFLCDVRL